MTDTHATEAAAEQAVEHDEVDEAVDPLDPQDGSPVQRLSEEELSALLRDLKKEAERAVYRGEQAFAILCRIQTYLVNQEQDLSLDRTYVLAGYKSRDDFREAVIEHTMFEAAKAYKKTQTRFTATLKNVGDHPAGYFDDAYRWIKFSTLPLFADSTFERLKTTQSEFFDRYREAHIDAARQKIRLAARLKEKGDTGPKGFDLMEAVTEDHLPRLGTDDIETHIAAKLESSAEEIDTLYAHFSQLEFKTVLNEIRAPVLEADIAQPVVVLKEFAAARAALPKKVKEHPYAYDSPQWHTKIIEAMHLIRENCGLEEDPDTYKGTQYTKDQFAAEFMRSMEAVLRNNMQAILREDVTPQEIDNAIRAFEDLRDMFPDKIDPPDDADPAHRHEDHWMYHIWREFDMRSYTHMLDNIQASMGVVMTNSTIEGGKPVSMTLIADNLLDAEMALQEARIATDYPKALAEINIDHRAVTQAMVQSAPFVANRDWSRSHHFGFLPDDHLDMLARMDRARQKLEGMIEEELVVFTHEQMLAQMRKANLRRIEIMLANSCITVQGPGAGHSSIKTAFEALKNVRMDIAKPEVHEPMGMSAARAGALKSDHADILLMERWANAKDEDREPLYRLNDLKALRAATGRMDPEQLAAFLQKTGAESVEEITGEIRKIARTLYDEVMQDCEKNADDPLRMHECLKTAALCLKAMHPRALKNDWIFKSLIKGGNRQEFLERLYATEKKVKDLTSSKPMGKNWRPAAALMVRAALNEKLSGEDSFEQVDAVSHHLHAQGHSIMDPQLLQAAGYTQETFLTAVEDRIFQAAKDCIEEADLRKGNPLRIQEPNEHASEYYRRAMRWVSRSSHFAMSDAPWQRLGFVSRDEFVEIFRESMRDFVKQADAILGSGQCMRKGAYFFIELMRQTVDGYEALGLHDQRVLRDIMRGALRNVGEAFVKEVLEDTVIVTDPQDAKLSPQKLALKGDRLEHGNLTRKYKLLHNAIKFVMDIDRGDVDKKLDSTTEVAAARRQRHYAQTMDAEFRRLTLARIHRAVKRYNPKKWSPARMVALATAVGTLRKRLGSNPDVIKAIDEMFQQHDFLHYEGFAYHAAQLRMKQLVRRIAATTKYGKARLTNPQTYVTVLRDLDHIDELAENGLFNLQERIDILSSMNLGPTWLQIARRQAAVYALPVIALSAQDPTLGNQERWDTLQVCNILGECVGTDMRRNLGVDWDKLNGLHTHTARRTASMQLLVSLVSDDWSVVSQYMADANRMLTFAGGSLADRETLKALNLSDEEATALVNIAPVIPGHQSLKKLRKVIEHNEGAEPLMHALVDFINECGRMQIDFAEPATMRALGFRDENDFRITFDVNVITCLAGLAMGAEGARQRTDAEAIRRQLEVALEIMDGARIGERHTDEVLTKSRALTRAEILAILPTVTPPDQLARPAAPAPV